MGSSFSGTRGAPASSAGPAPASAPAPAPTDNVEGLACRVLRDEILPLLERDRRRALAQAIDRVVARSRLDGLETLSAREKRELLEILEREVERAPRRPDARAIVRLTSVLSSAPAPDTAVARSLASPAR